MAKFVVGTKQEVFKTWIVEADSIEDAEQKVLNEEIDEYHDYDEGEVYIDYVDGED